MNERIPWNDYRARVKLTALRACCLNIFSSWARSAPGCRLRVCLYRIAGISIGRKVYIGHDCYLDPTCPELISIEDGAIVSFRVTIVAHNRSRCEMAAVTISRDAFIGTGAIILPGVVVGERAVVGAGAVVSRDVEPGTTVVNAPLRRIEHEAGVRE